MVADLTGGHTARIFCIGFDCTKVWKLLVGVQLGAQGPFCRSCLVAKTK